MKQLFLNIYVINYYMKKLKIRKNVVLGSVILIAFLLLLVSIYFYFSAQEKIRNERAFDYNAGPLLRESRFVALCDNNVIDSTCTIQKTKEEIDREFKRTRRPFVFDYHKYLIPLAAFIGLIFGLIVFWAMSEKEIKTKKNLINNTELILRMLPETHKKIIQTLLENNGKARQYELIEVTKLNKLKVHRILRDLENNQIIVKEKIGKVNNIMLSKDIYDTLKEN